MRIRPVLLIAGSTLALAVVLLCVGTDESSPMELQTTESSVSAAAAAVASPVHKQQLAGQGYVNWLRWAAKSKGKKKRSTTGGNKGKSQDIDTREFETPSIPQGTDFGKMSAAGKVLRRLRKTIGEEKSMIKRLERLVKDKKTGKKQPESVVVHVGQVGPRGPTGNRGPRGIRGNRGPIGPTGARGLPGDKGATGPRGNEGPRGKKGAVGEAGRRGITGRRGARGEEGAAGAQGKQGPRGYEGIQGPPGLQGTNGVEGPDGVRGLDGPVGLPGPIGPRGVPGKFIMPPAPIVTYPLSGSVTSAIANAPVPTATVTARQNGTIVATATAVGGNYRFAGLQSGTYQIHSNNPGFCESIDTLTILTQAAIFNINMSPNLENNQLRIVLTWGQEPRDLDSHLRDPANCLTYYGNRNGCAGASLDRDVTSGFGPETMTILQARPGTYRYRVHNYSRVSANLMVNGMANAPAKVTVYKGCTRHEFICGRDGDINAASMFWEVFDYDGATGTITRA